MILKLLRDKQTMEIPLNILGDKTPKGGVLWCLLNSTATLKSRSSHLGLLQDYGMISTDVDIPRTKDSGPSKLLETIIVLALE